MKFIPAGPPRFAHQKRALKRVIDTKGTCALLLDPGLGKSAVTLDFASILALKSQEIVDGDPEVRVLCISPKAAVDNWVLQAGTYIHEGVNVWAEALGGSIKNKAQTLASRGPDDRPLRNLPRKSDAAQDENRALNVDRAELTYFRQGGETLPEEFGKQGPKHLTGGPRLILLSTNYETFASRASQGSKTTADILMDGVRRFQPDVIVADEMHKLKGTGSNTSRLLSRIGNVAPRRIGLTGTVMPHSPMDVFAQWRFLQPTAFGRLNREGTRDRATFAGFQKRYGVFGGFMGREVVSYQNLDEMQRIMANNAIVVKKEDALDLPEMFDVVVSIALSTKEQGYYDEMKKDLATQLESGETATTENRLTQMLRLRQITAGHLPDTDGEVHAVGTTKIDRITSLVHDELEGEDRIVIFGLFRHEIFALRDTLARKGTEVLVINGDTPNEDRLKYRQRFGSKDPARIVLLAQIKTISLSVNELVTARHAIFASLSQQRDDIVQARDRLNRIGQTRSCTFHYVLAKGTVDEVIHRSHIGRTNLEAKLLEHIQGSVEGTVVEAQFD